MERNLNKLKKKYGTPKLVKFLRDLNPHLSQPQKKLNKEYIRYTRFGTPPRPPATGQSTTQVTPQKTPQKAAAEKKMTEMEQLEAEKMTEMKAERELVKRFGGVEVNVEAIKIQYNMCIQELASITKGYLNPAPLDSFSPDPKKDLEEKFLDIFKKYQGALHLVHNTKNLQIERKQHFGAKQKKKQKDGARRGGRGSKTPRARRTPPPTEPILMPQALLQHISPQAQPVPDTVVDDFKKRYKQTDSQTAGAQNRGWMNTYRQNNVDIGHMVEGTFNPPTRRQKEMCHCALCGARMFVFSDSHKNSACFHSTELEHQNPGSRAVELYIDVWKETIRDSRSVPAFLTQEERISSNDNKKFLLEYETIFFKTIGGSQASVENAFVYCCTLCNQIKSNMLPYYLKQYRLIGPVLEADDECLQAFDRRLKNVFIDSINGKLQGPDGGSVGDPQHYRERDCKLNYYYGCGLVWTCQIIATFIIPAEPPDIHKMKYTSTTTRSFYDGSLESIYDIMVVYKRLAGRRTPEDMWDSYVRKPAGQSGDQATFAYFGRPVDQFGKTQTDAAPYRTLHEKYADIMRYMKERLHSHQIFSI